MRGARGAPWGEAVPVGYLHRGVGAGFGVVHTQVRVELRPDDNGPLLSTPLHFLEHSGKTVTAPLPVKSNCSPHDAITVVLLLLLRSYSCSDGAIGAVSETLESSVFPFSLRSRKAVKVFVCVSYYIHQSYHQTPSL